MSWELVTALKRDEIIETVNNLSRWGMGPVVERRRRVSTDLVMSFDEPSKSDVEWLTAGGYTGDFCVMLVMGEKVATYVKGSALENAARFNILTAHRRATQGETE